MKTLLVPAGAGEALGLLRLQTRAGGDDEHVVGEDGAVVEQDLVALDADRVDLSLVEDDAVSQLPFARPDDLVQRGEPEGDEEQARLVDVAVVAVDDVDLGLVGVEAPAQPVGDHRAAGAAAQDDDPLARHRHRLAPAARHGHRGFLGASFGELRAEAQPAVRPSLLRLRYSRTWMLRVAHMSLRTCGQTVTLTSPRWALRSSSIMRPGLADAAADRQRQGAVDDRPVVRQVEPVELAGELELLAQRRGVDADAHRAQLVPAPGHRVPHEDVAVEPVHGRPSVGTSSSVTQSS